MGKNCFSKSVTGIMPLVLFTLSLTLVACTPAASPKSEPVKQEAPLIKSGSSWEQTWQDLIKSAQKEGKVSIRGSYLPGAREALSEAFKKNFGVELEVQSGKTAELLPKTLIERRAGIFVVDIHEGGPSDMLGILKPQDMIEKLDGLVFLPEVVDEKLWDGGYGPFFDRDHKIVGSSSDVLPPILINSRMVNREELKSYNDLLNPKWKGKIVMGDPTVSGGQQGIVVAMREIMGTDFLLNLLEQQKPVFTRDKVQIVDWVAKEKYAISIGGVASVIKEYRDAGVTSLQTITPAEGARTLGTGVLVIYKQAPHPNAARLYMNWILTKEGQAITSRVTGYSSRRLDVSNDWIPAEFRKKPGIKYIEADEEYYLKEAAKRKAIIEIFEPYIK